MRRWLLTVQSSVKKKVLTQLVWISDYIKRLFGLIDLLKGTELMKKTNKIISILLVVLMTAGLLAGCGGSGETGEKESVTVYMWSSVLLNSYAPYIQEQLPDVDVEFIVGNNDLDYYKFLKENGELPDIITCRRFSLHDASELKDNLMDLSTTEEAGAVYDSYIGNFTNTDDTINWLPLCGEADGLVANKAVFDKYNIPLPTDYDSLVSACQEFEKHGIRGFVADFAYDYTCMEILQGLSISEINSMEGRLWRSQYEDPENLDVTGLDSEIWPGVFERMEKFIKDVNIQPEDVNLDYDPPINMFMEGKAAVIRSGGSNTVAFNDMGIEAVFLPYFCQDGAEWMLTYPAFQVAVNKDVEKDEAHKKDVMKVLEVMVSDGGQNSLAEGEDVITYSQNVNLEMSPSLDNLKDTIEQNQMYIRIASNDFFATSLDVVHKMIKGEYNAKQAYTEFNRQLENSEAVEAERVLTVDKTYSNRFKPEGGRESSSAMAGSLREMYESDVVVAPAYSFTETVIKADYSEKMVNAMIMPNSLEAWACDMTGAQLKEYIKASVEGIEGGFKPFNEGMLPAVSGVSVEVEATDDGFVLTKVLKDGKELDDNEKLKVTCLNTQGFMEPLLALEGCDFQGYESRVVEQWLEYIKNGGKIASSEPYITLK